MNVKFGSSIHSNFELKMAWHFA